MFVIKIKHVDVKNRYFVTEFAEPKPIEREYR